MTLLETLGFLIESESIFILTTVGGNVPGERAVSLASPK
jgi:hypothetical protein